MKPDPEKTIKVTGVNDGTGTCVAVILAFGLFWALGGWHRVDCGLGIQKACELIAAEKEYSK